MWPTNRQRSGLAGRSLLLPPRHHHLLLAATLVMMLNVLTVQSLIHSPPRIIKQPPPDEMLFQVAQQGESDKPFLIECEAEGEPTPKEPKIVSVIIIFIIVIDDEQL
uniref:Uncharacterized protein n=1 Tax=Anopheles atroparvus TaxID=41427 RepID=A0A182IYZ2_ANOAO